MFFIPKRKEDIQRIQNSYTFTTLFEDFLIKFLNFLVGCFKIENKFNEVLNMFLELL